MLKEKEGKMANTIPHIKLFIELQEAIEPVLETLEPLYAYFYSLSTRSRKEGVKPSGFYFLLANSWSKEGSLDVVIDFYKNVNILLLVLSEIERVSYDFFEKSNLFALISTSKALRQNILDISPMILKIKDREELIYSKNACKKLFLYTESVRALTEEFSCLKELILEESMYQSNILLTKEPLDLKGDLE
jgi:hypothetical protein